MLYPFISLRNYVVDHVSCMISSFNNHVNKYGSRDRQGNLWLTHFHTSNNHLKTGFY